MRVGLDISSVVYRTGVSDYTANLARSLSGFDVDLRLFAFSLRKKQQIKIQFPAASVYSLPPTFLHYLWNKLHIVNIENFTGPLDIYHASDWTQAPATAKKITTVHDLSPFLYPREMSSGGFRDIVAVHRARMQWVVKECDAIICVSHSTATDLIKLFPDIPLSKISVIYEALPARFLPAPSAGDINKLKSHYQLKDYLIAIGTPQPRKNIQNLIRTFLEYKDRLNLPEKLVIVGGHGWGLTQLPANPDIIFTGFLPDADLLALLAGSSVFVYPSLYEGFGLPVLIAFHHQIPVVTSNISSLPEVAGDAAVLVDPFDHESIAYGIQAAIKNKSKLVKAGILQLNKFSWSATANQTESVYKSLC